jgi:uncharacterized RDD family membrane protein YckC
MADDMTEGSAGGPPAFPSASAPPPSSVPAPMPPPTPPPTPPSDPLVAQAPPPMPPPPPPPASYPAGASAPFPAPPFDGSSGLPYAMWGSRLGGYLIDLLIFLPVLIVLYFVFKNQHVLQVHLMMRSNGTHRREHFSLLSFILTSLMFIVYATVLCGGPRGQTVGMRLVGTRVVRESTNDVLGYGVALGRAVVEQIFRLLGILSILLGVVWLLDMLWPLWDKKKQTLHDKVVRTVVLRVSKDG